jgi:arylsulfatase A-like enzyme
MPTRAPFDRPNIILVNCDDLGWGDLCCTGHPSHRTPHLDRMAAEGMVFTDFCQASSLCSPSRGAMLTGCYPRRIGFDRFEGRHVLFPGQGVGLDPREITFARLLQQQGYATQMVGKWHCGDQPAFLPTRHGFERYFGLPYSNDMGRQSGRPPLPPLPLLDGEDVLEAQPDQASLTQRYAEHCVRFVRDARDGPFLLYLAHMHVHLPLYVPERFVSESLNGRYGAAVACVDWVMGVLLHEIRRLGLDRNTLVLFTSDNGSRCDFGPSNGHLRGKKGSTWEGGFRTPLLARWLGVVPAGARCHGLVTGMDFLPTFAELAGTLPPVDRPIDGRSFARLLRGGATGGGSLHDAFFYYDADALAAVRAGQWKLHVSPPGGAASDRNTHALYDLHADPGETADVAAAQPDVVRQLMRQIDRSREDLGDAATASPGTGRRPIGRVSDPRPLTTYDPDCPYFMAVYDLATQGDGQPRQALCKAKRICPAAHFRGSRLRRGRCGRSARAELGDPPHQVGPARDPLNPNMPSSTV